MHSTWSGSFDVSSLCVCIRHRCECIGKERDTPRGSGADTYTQTAHELTVSKRGGTFVTRNLTKSVPWRQTLCLSFYCSLSRSQGLDPIRIMIKA